MEINEDFESQIKEAMDVTDCPKDFECYRNGFEKMCKVKLFGAKSLFTCHDENPQNCRMSLSYGNIFFCKCPLRILVAKKLNK